MKLTRIHLPHVVSEVGESQVFSREYLSRLFETYLWSLGLQQATQEGVESLLTFRGLAEGSYHQPPDFFSRESPFGQQLMG